MLIKFDEMEITMLEKFYGGEKSVEARMFVDERNRIMCSRLEPGASIGYHKHENGSEMIYILQGKGKALYDDGEEELYAGVCHYCPKGHSHSVINNSDEDLIFFAVVTQQ